jgi:fructuronate reductase
MRRPELSVKALWPQRLTAGTVALARAERPTYDRTSPPVIAHLGFGSFAKAHLGRYADDLLRSGRPGMIRGVSIRSRGAEDRLTPQDGLYTVAEREPGSRVSLRVLGALASMETGAAAALDAIAAPTTKLVTLTITEKGYEVTAEELEPAEAPMSAPALIALALARRRRAGLAPPVFASLDNLLDNGRVLRTRVVEAANRFDPSLAEWITCEVAFPSSVVDRMVPAPTERDLEDIGSRLGLVDRAAVSTEHHRSWIVGAVEALEPLAEVGVELVDDVTPFERRKLWLLNGPHSAVAYGGLLAGCDTIAHAVGHAVVAPFVRRLGEQTLEVAALPAALGPAQFVDDALRRFANPTLGHTCAQVGADGSSKLPQRLVPVAAARRARGLDTDMFAVVVAIWIAATAGLRVRGAELPALEDPVAADLRSAVSRGDGLHRLSSLALAGRADASFVADVARALDRLGDSGLALLEAPW